METCTLVFTTYVTFFYFQLFRQTFGKVVIDLLLSWENKLHRESCCTWRERKIERCKYYNQILFDGAQTVKASK